MVRALSTFLDFCYLVRQDEIDEDALQVITDTVSRFHDERSIFEDVGIRPDGISLPRQHSIKHYPSLIQLFAAPNGLCSSITESKHIKAVKEPWRRTNKHKALGQMLVINQRLDKLTAARIDFESRGMLGGTSLPVSLSGIQAEILGDVEESSHEDDNDDDDGIVDGDVDAEVVLAKCPGMSRVMVSSEAIELMYFFNIARGFPNRIEALSAFLDLPTLPLLTARFLYEQLNPDINIDNIAPHQYPTIHSHIGVYPSAIATYYAPSDPSGIKGMRRERIRSVSTLR